MYAPNKRASKYMRQTLIGLQEKRDKFTTIVGHFKSPVLITDKSSRWKIRMQKAGPTFSANLTQFTFIGDTTQQLQNMFKCT